jgi:putative ABC transport system permease protein
MALGAQRRDVFQLVIGRGVWMVSLGIILGWAGALVLTHGIRSLLFEVSPADPSTFAAVSLLLIVVALLATCLPAHRAAKTDPMEALRHE